MSNYDYNIIHHLQNLFHQAEGCSFQVGSQTKFHEKVFSTLKPTNIIETGTHKALYDYMIRVNVPEVKINTFGIDPESKLCVDYLNNYFGKYIVFHEGNSINTLTNFRSKSNFDLAWIDGGHSRYEAYIDLINCARLGVKNITIDDLDLEGVEVALNWFIEDKFVIDDRVVRYKIIDQDPAERKITWLQAYNIN